MQQTQEQILSGLISGAKEEVYTAEQEVALAEKAINEYPPRFLGSTILDYQEWEAGRRQLQLALEEKQQALRHAKWTLDDLLKQKQLNLF